MKNLSKIIRMDREIERSFSTALEQYSEKTPYPVVVNGLSGSALCFYIKECIEYTNKSALSVVFVSSDEERERVVSELSYLGVNAVAYKPRNFVFHNISASHDAERERLSVLHKILSGEALTVVTTPSAALSYTMPQRELSRLSLKLSVGFSIEPSMLCETLVDLGFKKLDSVESAGQFSQRGGIVDIYYSHSENPVRIEFFGDEIDRISYFDSVSQRSVSPCESVTLTPASEVVLTKAKRERLSKLILELSSAAKEADIKEKLELEYSICKSDLNIDFRDRYLGIIYDTRENLLSYVSSFGRAYCFIIDTSRNNEEISKSIDSIEKQKKAFIEMGIVSERAAKYSAGADDYQSFLAQNVTVHLNTFSASLGTAEVSGLFGIRYRRAVSYGGNFSMLTEDLENLVRGGYKTLLISENEEGAASLFESLSEKGIAVHPAYKNNSFDFTKSEPGEIFVAVGRIASGFELISARVAVFSMAKDEGRRIMQERRRKRILRKSGGAGQRLMSYADLSVGDYVVHANYGIGLFEGMQSVTVDGVTKDYITIRYAGTDKLFVPCDRLELIGKYIGEKDKDGKVKLSKMGGSEWTRVKSKAKSAAKDIAKDLILLYAERERRPGFAFGEDTELEEQFASDFEYEETDSQTLAIEEIKADMMRPVPMNRLLCGDVGFGKTEVALRAAFKAIVCGKQVAFLVPTTILALQHFQTAVSRMRGYPVTVEMISRFRTPKEIEKILERVKFGKVDMLIGTHKLLSKNVEFNNLGLLIIDEEQRFGVAQKEKLKDIARNVDVLTLSATPIPRTLNMAMNGISDMSILDEAPGDRRPVQTYVLEHDDTVITEAMEREISRGGQVLYLYNKVEDIAYRADKIMNALPMARVAFAHGQMDKSDLEDIWQMLVKGEIDILVATTIIETGVDLPNANTLIIENADRMGLSQLHQIRGRVGRSARQAYAYFTFRRGKALSEIATKRLSAIREFAEFGAGFKVALRDLEIRGAGNLLGAEQHGYIDSVGYDLYVKLLSEAVLEERGIEREIPFESNIDIKVSAYIPEHYIETSAARMEMYKKISLLETREDAEEITDELIDRFGDPPKAVMTLLDVAFVKALSSRAHIHRVEYKEGYLNFHLEKLELSLWSELFEKYKGLTFRAAKTPVITIRTKGPEVALVMAREILCEYVSLFSCEEKKEEKNESK